MAVSLRKQHSVEPRVESSDGGIDSKFTAASPASTELEEEAKSQESGSDWEQGRSVKKVKTSKIPKVGETKPDFDDYGTLALQRPQRARRVPQRFQYNNPLSSTKSRPRNKISSILKPKAGQRYNLQKPTSQKTTRTSARNKYGFPISDQASVRAGDSPDNSKQSIVVSLNVGSERLARFEHETEEGIPLPSTPAWTPADDILLPTSHESSIEVQGSYNLNDWAPRTSDDSPQKVTYTMRDVDSTPQGVPSQKTDQPVLPPTPTSASGSDNLALLLSDLPRVASLFEPAPSVADSESTTEDEGVPEILEGSPEVHELRALAEQLTHRQVGKSKPEPAGAPEVWADGRQELCETLHYYRAYQSACYSTGGFARGFMFDKVAHARDYIDSNVVISRAGGGQLKDKETGELRAGRDQVDDSVAQNLRNCKSHYNPVVILAGVDNPHFPSQPPHQYCVMDYFKPTHIWFEKDGKSKIVRYRFEKLNAKKDSWWRPKGSTELMDLGSLPPPNKEVCQVCEKISTQVYLNGWMCLQPTCRAFWNIHGLEEGYEPEDASLIYDPRFLKQKTPWPNDDHNYPLTSNNVKLSGHSIPGEDTSQAFWLGTVCPDCGRCNSRLNWLGWECGNPTCNFRKEPPHTLVPALSLREPLWPVTSGYTLSRDTQSSRVNVRVTFAHGYRINRYSIPGISGFITHTIANKTVLEESGGPDSMFEELQKVDIGLRRRSMPNGQLKGPNHSRHFTVNYGMPYKFIAAAASHSFDGAARPITATRSRLNWAAKLLLSQERGATMQDISKTWEREGAFNEVLALGYFESQKINYHDDGEFGLGPTIATLSLGAPGNMRIRMKARHYHGVSTAGVYDDVPPLPGCQQYEARLALQPTLDALKLSDPKGYTTQRRQIPKDLGLKGKGNAKEVLNMQLGHGDIVVMHGRELQKYYEHAVEHAGKLRFALTCRYIDAESLKEEDRAAYEVGPVIGGYDGSGLM
ncbi:hypothetical protein T440DRAFT_501594 [Plenodomus tracheiphilus IPT5]|uniref:Alpha-ketoglutarate-dependent dioxygenase AlkB-like domain-containing protein n=1 Tax=Plenodomus tracheiphilus IPT5 TaxID=1408161 RepID=A0A6A7ATU7_9PLEO|nr:hypothetical protein T440DRAFT_501594 [Plenodomus tracheiphilus IPT5]